MILPTERQTTQETFTLQHNITNDHVGCHTSRDVTGKLNLTGLEPDWQAYALTLNHYDMKNLCTRLGKNQKPLQQCSYKSENVCHNV